MNLYDIENVFTEGPEINYTAVSAVLFSQLDGTEALTHLLLKYPMVNKAYGELNELIEKKKLEIKVKKAMTALYESFSPEERKVFNKMRIGSF